MTGENKVSFDIRDWIEYSMIDDDGQSINSPKRIALMNLQPEDELMENGKQVDLEEIEDKLPVNPIDFYDNDDGFWDDYIKEKHGYFDVKNLHYRPFEVYSDMLKRKDI